MTMAQILDRLRALDRQMNATNAKRDDVTRALDALILDIEIHCTRTGVPLV